MRYIEITFIRLVGEHNLVLSEALKNFSNLLNGVSRNPNMLKRFSDQATILQVRYDINVRSN